MACACISNPVRLKPGQRLLQLSLTCGFLIGICLAVMRSSTVAADSQEPQSNRAIGREVAIQKHLQDGDETRLTMAEILAHGKALFDANWTNQEGGGRPLSKGTGRPLSDTTQPLTGARAFNRISAPDANSCTGCHNAPYGLSGGGGDFVTNVFVLGQRFDSVTFDPSDTLPTRGTADEAGQAMSLQSIAN